MKTIKFLIFPLFFLFTITASYSQKVIDADSPNYVPKKDICNIDDMIIDGSINVGFDAVCNRNFGFDTAVFSENNLRIYFEDTSNSASFPANDWRIVINDTTNGGSNYFGIEDSSAGRIPFRVEAGAPNHSLFVEDSGDIGLNTANPVTELHMVDGDSPTMRLEQDGSSGFTPQTWDVAGNETNFFIRDATNGSKLPFKIKPGAADNSIFIAANSDIGLGTASPDADLHVRRTDASATELHLQNTNGTAQNINIRMTSPTQVYNQQLRNNNSNYRLRNVTSATTPFEIAWQNNAVTTAGDITANGVLLTSDLRLKKNVKPFTAGLSVINQLNPISYNFNGKAGFKSIRQYFSIGAQELQKAAPYLVHDFIYENEDAEGNILSTEEYLKIDFSAMTWVLVNSVKEQQVLIEEKEVRITELEDEMEAIKNQLNEINTLLGLNNDSKEVIINGKQAFLGQNFPNPHKGETVIEYFIPTLNNNAEIQVYDISGKLIKTVSINEAGKGQVNLTVKDLPNGNYSYALSVDGKLVDTKRMIQVK